MAFLKLFQDGFRLLNGSDFNKIFNGQTQVPALSVQSVPIQTLTAAGTTQLGATLISGPKAIITVATTASTHGVRLPSAATGLEVEVGNSGAFGVKVWPFLSDKIGAAATNAADATVLAVNKTNRYLAVNTTLWIVQRGA